MSGKRRHSPLIMVFWRKKLSLITVLFLILAIGYLLSNNPTGTSFTEFRIDKQNMIKNFWANGFGNAQQKEVLQEPPKPPSRMDAQANAQQLRLQQQSQIWPAVPHENKAAQGAQQQNVAVQQHRQVAVQAGVQGGAAQVVARQNANIPHQDLPVIDAMLPDKSVMELWNEETRALTFHNYLKTTQVTCNHFVRMGPPQMDGWDLCHMDPFRPRPPCLMYSFALDTDFTFEEDVANRYQCQVYYFDPTKTAGVRKSGVHVHAIQIGDQDGITDNNRRVRKLSSIRKELGHFQRINILVMDVGQQWEWTAIPEMVKSGAIGNVTQLAVEFHVKSASGKRTPDSAKYLEGLMLLRELYEAGFRIAISTGGTYKYEVFGVMYPGVYDILFLRVL